MEKKIVMGWERFFQGHLLLYSHFRNLSIKINVNLKIKERLKIINIQFVSIMKNIASYFPAILSMKSFK